MRNQIVGGCPQSPFLPRGIPPVYAILTIGGAAVTDADGRVYIVPVGTVI